MLFNKRLLLLVVTFSLIVHGTLSGQCPDRDSLWKRMSELQHSTAPNSPTILQELLTYDKRLSNCPDKADSVYTSLLMKISVLNYLSSDFSKAIYYSKKALQVIKSNPTSPAIRKADIPKFYYYLNIFYDSLRMAAQKNEAIDSCIANEKRIGLDYKYTCFVLSFKVRDLFFRGDYNLCADYASFGESIVRRYYQGQDSILQLVYFITYYTNSLYSLGRFTDAETFLQNKKAQFLAGNNKFCLGVIYSLLGYVNKVRGENQKALTFFTQSYQSDQQTREKEISAEVLGQIGLIYAENLHQPALGIPWFHKALRFSRGFNSFYQLGNIAKAYAGLNKFDSAYKYFQQAFNLIRPGISEKDLMLHMDEYVYVNNVQYVLNVVLDKADTYLREFNTNHNHNNLKKALEVYSIADKLLNSAKAEQREIESRLFWRTYGRRLYDHAIEACYLNRDSSQAFYFFEKSRAVLLNDQLTEQHWLHGDEFLKMAEVKRKILQGSRELAQTNQATQRYIQLQEEQYSNKKELNRLQEAIKDRYAIYYQGLIDSGFINLQGLQRDLQIDTRCMLELFSGDSAVYVLLITPTSTHFDKIDKSEFEKLVREYTAYISNLDKLNSDYQGFRKISAQLYHLLFRNNESLPARIIVSPDINYFPFECLVSDNTSSSPVYFLSTHAVSYTYSARYLQNKFSTAMNNMGSFMGMAPISFASQMNLASLAGSDESLNKIGNYFSDPNLLIKSGATKNNFQRQFPDYRIVQLYTHAAENSNFKEPVIYFGDSALYLSDLIPEKKPLTQLVVLSACETGVGTLYKGEGVFSFNRGFAAIGVPSSIANLWSIDNESTYQLTELFYKYLSKGLSLDVALQQAKLEYINSKKGENQLPYYWAAPILVGKADAIELTKTYAWKYVFAGIGFVAIALFGGWRLLRRKRFVSRVPGTKQTAP